MVTNWSIDGIRRWGIWKSCHAPLAHKEMYTCSGLNPVTSDPSANNYLRKTRGYAIISGVALFSAVIISIVSMRYNNKPLCVVLAIMVSIFFVTSVVTTVLVIVFASRQLQVINQRIGYTPSVVVNNMKMGASWWIYLTSAIIGVPLIVLSSLSARFS